MKVVTTVNLEKNTLEIAKRIAWKEDISLSQLIRKLLKGYTEKEQHRLDK